MKRIVFAAAVFPALLAAQNHDWRLHEEDTARRSFTLPAAGGAQKLLVDNVTGYVHVTGYAGSEVQITAHKQIGADSAEAMAEAKRDIKLDMNQQGNFVRVYVDGPFRSKDGVNYRGDRYYGYRVKYNFDIQVPYSTELDLKSINDGTIEVKKTTGDFTINGLNGGIEMQDISGSGTVRTLNGPLSVWFNRNPAKSSEFHTLNGKMDIYFQPGLNADLSFSSLNGGVWSDFEIGPRTVAASAAEQKNGKFVFRSGRNTVGRAGSGGPELKFEALNGAIRLHSKAAI
jgi:hypothetical protein